MSQSGVLESVAEGVWSASGDIKLMPGFFFPVTSHVVRLESGGLFVHSPIDFSAETIAAIRKLGEVEMILAPNLFHTSYLKQAHETFPEARLLGPRGLDEKFPELPFSELLGEERSTALGDDFEHVFVRGAPKFNELVLRHKGSSALISADYFFNIHETRGFLTRPILKFASGALGQATQSKLWRKVTKDKAAAKQSAQDVLDLDFQRILVSHGRPIDEGRAVAEKSLSWLLSA